MYVHCIGISRLLQKTQGAHNDIAISTPAGWWLLFYPILKSYITTQLNKYILAIFQMYVYPISEK